MSKPACPFAKGDIVVRVPNPPKMVNHVMDRTVVGRIYVVERIEVGFPSDLVVLIGQKYPGRGTGHIPEVLRLYEPPKPETTPVSTDKPVPSHV